MSRKTKNRRRRSSRTRKLGRRRMKGGFWPFTSEESNYTYQPQQSWEEWASSLGKKTKEGATSFWDKTKSTFSSSSDSYSSTYVPSTSTYVPSTSTSVPLYESSTTPIQPAVTGGKVKRRRKKNRTKRG